MEVAGTVNLQVPVFLQGIRQTEPCAFCSPGADVAIGFFPGLELVTEGHECSLKWLGVGAAACGSVLAVLLTSWLLGSPWAAARCTPAPPAGSRCFWDTPHPQYVCSASVLKGTVENYDACVQSSGLK